MTRAARTLRAVALALLAMTVVAAWHVARAETRYYGDKHGRERAARAFIFLRPILYTNGVQFNSDNKPMDDAGIFTKSLIGGLVFFGVYALLKR